MGIFLLRMSRGVSIGFLFFIVVFSFGADARMRGKKNFALFGGYLASIRDTSYVSNLYDGMVYGASLGYRRRRVEYFVSFRQSQQRSNYTNIEDPSIGGNYLALGARYEDSWRKAIVPVVEISGVGLIQNGVRTEFGYGVSGAVGIGLRLSRKFTLRTVAEVSFLFIGKEQERMRSLYQRLDLSLHF